MGNFNMLPNETNLEIFSRLPTESVLECKSVSKQWRNLLQHQSFWQMHLNRLNDLFSAHNSGKLSFIFSTKGPYREPFWYIEYDDKSSRFSTTRINLRPPFKNCYILGSCNGLICFNARFDDKDFVFQPAYICNPITREYIVLPKFVGNGFMLSGFGYGSSTNEYKVVRISTYKTDPNFGIIQVYTLGSGTGWRNGRKMDYDVISFFPHGVFANGAIYWVDRRGTIVAFDLDDEEFVELPSPKAGDRHSIVKLDVVGNLLCACYLCAGSSDIWVLKKDKNSQDVVWSKEFSDVQTTDKWIAFTKSGGILCYDYGDWNFYCYSPKASSFRLLLNFGKNLYDGVPHRNTLVSLKALGEEDTKLMDTGERARSSGDTNP